MIPDACDVTVKVHRHSPSAEGGRSWVQEYPLRVSRNASVLDCLLLIKRTQDPSLAFRYSCGHGMCGSDAVAINGVPRLLCLTKVAEAGSAATLTKGSADTTPAAATPTTTAATTAITSTTAHEAQSHDPLLVEVAPLPAFPAIRDLIVDLDPMLDQIRRLTPYLRESGALRTLPNGKINVFEYLQHPDELDAFDQLTNCIACGVCEGACPIYVQGTPFIGPTAAVAAGRFIFDTRDGATQERLDAIDSSDGIWPCKGLRFCTQRCPRGIDVSGAIWKIMKAIKANKDQQGFISTATVA